MAGTKGDVRGLSRVLHAIDWATSQASCVAGVVVVVGAALVWVIATGFSASSEAAFAAVSSAITLIMVFVIQHTQSREQRALQVKLDELVRALPQADDSFVHVEGSSDEELQELEVRHIESHAALRGQRPAG